jgi:peroxiredoxin
VVHRAAPEFRGGHIWLAVSVALALSAALFGMAAAQAAESATFVPWTRGDRPPFKLDDLDRQAVALEARPGQLVLVHFFATWCEPCRDELASLRRLVERTDPARLRVVAISVAEVDARVRSFIEKVPVNFPILLDRDRAVARSWEVSALPTSFILDARLQPRLFIERDYDWDKLDVAALSISLSRLSPAANHVATVQSNQRLEDSQ